MLGLAEEIGLVCGDGIDQVDEFACKAVAVKKETAIFRNVAVAEAPDAPAQAPVDHQALCRRQSDPDMIPDEGCQPREILAAKPIRTERLLHLDRFDAAAQCVSHE